MRVSNRLDLGETPRYSASHPDLSCLHMFGGLRTNAISLVSNFTTKCLFFNLGFLFIYFCFISAILSFI